jgi:hypothetical protein
VRAQIVHDQGQGIGFRVAAIDQIFSSPEPNLSWCGAA